MRETLDFLIQGKHFYLCYMKIANSRYEERGAKDRSEKALEKLERRRQKRTTKEETPTIKLPTPGLKIDRQKWMKMSLIFLSIYG